MSKKCTNNSCQKKTSIGGQALIEGIMMRGPQVTAMAVRDPNGNIVLEKWDTPATSKSKIAKLPIIRGVLGFINSMRYGYKCLMRSAEIAMPEELTESAPKKDTTPEKNNIHEETATEPVLDKEAVTEEAEETDPVVEEVTAEHISEVVATELASEESAPAEEPASEKEPKQKKQNKPEKEKTSPLMTVIMIVASVLGVVLGVGLFFMLPTFIYSWCAKVIPFLTHENPALNSLIKSVFEGILKIAVLVTYMLLVRLMKDIKRTFQYHGAEHKTIFCYEHGKELTVENVRGERRFHPRCGTSFLILMLIVGIFISFFIDPLSLLIWDRVPPTAIRAVIRLLLLPLMMGIGYELIKLAGKYDNRFTRIISAPGMWLQHVTVLEPDDDMIECAITAFKEVIPKDEGDNY